jgi:hypothetical protein
MGGCMLLLLAGFFWLSEKTGFPLGKLPGDISITKPGFNFYFPLTTCILISIFFTLVLMLFNKLRN